MRLFRFFTVTLIIAFISPATAWGKWEYGETVDDFTDEKRVYAFYIDPDEVTLTLAEMVIIRCTYYLEVVVATKEFLNTKFKEVPVKWRVDKGEVVEQTWKAYDGTDVFIANEEGRRFARALMKGHRLVFRATDYNGYDHTIKFSLKGSKKPIQKVLSFCKIKRFGS